MVGIVFVKNAEIKRRVEMLNMANIKDYLYLGKKCNCCGRSYQQEEHQFFYNKKYTFYEDMGVTFKKQEHIELDICKSCVRWLVNPRDIDTVLPVLKYLDIPFIIEEWENIVKYYNYDNTCIGRYIAKMQLFSFKNYIYDDSNEINYRYYKVREKY